jgi:hypothetical protein
MQYQEREQKAVGSGNGFVKKTQSSACCVLSASGEEYARASPYLAEVLISELLAANISVRASMRPKTQDSRRKRERERGKREERGGIPFSLLPPSSLSCVLRLASWVLGLLLLYGCGMISPPVDYYQQVLEMEEHGEQTRRDTGRRPGEIIAPIRDSEPIRIEKSPVHHLMPDVPQQQTKETSVVEQEEIQEELEPPPRREVVRESPPSPTSSPEPIAVSPDVIKSALEPAALGVSIRTVELVNGRLSGGKNSVRVSFFSESVNAIDDKFVAICAVIYNLDQETNTVDVVVGIAEDEQANLLAILQSNMSDITAWITNKFSRAEWFSRVTKKIL